MTTARKGYSVPILHVCSQEQRLRDIEREQIDSKRLQSAQNEALQKIADVAERIENALPRDLDSRLRTIETLLAGRTAVTGLFKWILGIAGFGAVIGLYNLFKEENAPLHQLWHSAIKGNAVALVGLVVFALFSWWFGHWRLHMRKNGK